MAAALKAQFGAASIDALAKSIAAVFPAFPVAAFCAQAKAGFEPLDLLARGRHVALALRQHLPSDLGQALDILTRAMGQMDGSEGKNLSPFFYLPHSAFVAAYGLENFEAAMKLQYELTQRFTAEFCLRPFLERFPERTLARLRVWAGDPSASVRRLVSEGTRPRLPWAPRLKVFASDPGPVLELLERLKDDPDAAVRRSVANHLNDLGKDHPDLLLQTARRWLPGASENRRALLRQALRSLVKQGAREALEILGFGRQAKIEVDAVEIAPRQVKVGERVEVRAVVRNPGHRAEELLLDLRVHFVKGRGEARPKVFRLRALRLAAGESAAIKKTISLAQLSTRKHYAGRHEIEILINGRPQPLGSFMLAAQTP